MKQLTKYVSRFIKDRRGIAWVWAVAGISIVLTPFVYLPMSLIWDKVSTIILADYTFTGTTAYAVTFAQLIISYLAVFALFYVVIWMWVNSKSEAFGGA